MSVAIQSAVPSEYHEVIVSKARSLAVKDPAFTAFCEQILELNATLVLAGKPTTKTKRGMQSSDLTELMSEDVPGTPGYVGPPPG